MIAFEIYVIKIIDAIDILLLIAPIVDQDFQLLRKYLMIEVILLWMFFKCAVNVERNILNL